MRALSRSLALLVCVVALGGCDSRALRWDSSDTYTVQSGDTVYAIAFRFGLDYRQLAAWNGLSGSYLIHPGDVIRLNGPSGTTTVTQATRGRPKTAARKRPPAEPAPDWHWPTQGRVVAGFVATNGNGVDIAGKKGQPVFAAAGGRVVYSGSGLIGYGQLIIVKHNNTYLSAYGHNDDLLVAQGATVKAGQRIATMGKGPGERPVLHFEIRQNGEPVDPIRLLPKR